MKSNLIILKSNIIKNVNIQTLLGLAEIDLGDVVTATKYVPEVSEPIPKIAIFAKEVKDLNPRVETVIIEADVHVPLIDQNETGIGLDIMEEIKSSLNGQKIGRGLKYEDSLPDQETAKGWWKGTILFRYNSSKN